LGYAVALMRALRESDTTFPYARFEVDVTADPSVALEHAERDDIDIYIVDLKFRNAGLEDDAEIGKSLVKEIHSKAHAGLIVHTTVPAEIEAVELLLMGADDYIEKMSRDGDYTSNRGVHQIIRAKIISVWRRVQLIRPATAKTFVHWDRAFRIGDWLFVSGFEELTHPSGQRLKISATEHAFLRHLCTVEDNEIDRPTFNVSILGRKHSDKDKRMDNFIYRLRLKLGPSVQLISKRDGVYRLLPVTEIQSDRVSRRT